ncbi:MAG: YdcF family protein [Notoacmeibacter sp.]|nr:YdcF family protein [Notoacmeibacter sp.]
MFFYLSKIAWFVIQPMGLLFILLFLTLAAGISRRPRMAVLFSGVAMILIAVFGWTNAGQLLLQPLEDRFSRPDPPPAAVTGIIVLGGGMEGAVNLARGGYELQQGGDRLVEAAILARRYPDARIVISGGSGALMTEGEDDATSASRLFKALGVAEERLILESRSRNTAENAAYSRDLVAPKAGQTWLLVTSAFHMPRAIGLFRKAGFEIVPWPADYRTPGPRPFGRAMHSPIDSFNDVTTGLREWIGLFSYRATGLIDEILPAPRRRALANPDP